MKSFSFPSLPDRLLILSTNEHFLQLGRHLPLIARAVIRAVFDLPYDPESLKVPGADYNIVQNNGKLPPSSLTTLTHNLYYHPPFPSPLILHLPTLSKTSLYQPTPNPPFTFTGPLAAQVVPHIHHHIIPRPADPPRTISSKPHKTPNPTSRLPQVPPAVQTSWTMFGRGSRTDLDETDPETQQLVRRMRVEIAREFGRESHGLRWSSAGIENEAPQPNEQAAALRPRDTDKASL